MIDFQYKIILPLDLQMFAKEGPGGEKTEPATAKKLSDSRKEGKVAKSRELVTCFEILIVFLLIKFYVGIMGYDFIELFSNLYQRIPEFATMTSDTAPEQNMTMVLGNVMLLMLKMMAPILIIAFIVGAVGGFIGSSGFFSHFA